MKAEWRISGSGLPDLEIEAESFDEAIAKARLLDRGYCGGQIIEKPHFKEAKYEIQRF